MQWWRAGRWKCSESGTGTASFVYQQERPWPKRVGTRPYLKETTTWLRRVRANTQNQPNQNRDHGRRERRRTAGLHDPGQRWSLGTWACYLPSCRSSQVFNRFAQVRCVAEDKERHSYEMMECRVLLLFLSGVQANPRDRRTAGARPGEWESGWRKRTSIWKTGGLDEVMQGARCSIARGLDGGTGDGLGSGNRVTDNGLRIDLSRRAAIWGLYTGSEV